MDDVTLRELVDDLPTESLELYTMAYEAGEVDGYWEYGYQTPRPLLEGECRCPRAALGYPVRYAVPGISLDLFQLDWHPAFAIEIGAFRGKVDTAELYDECVWAIAERDASLDDLPQPEREAVGAK